MTSPLRLVFMGAPALAATALGHLLEAGHRVEGVYTQPDRPAGRGRKLTAPPTKTLAQSRGIPVYQPARFKEPGALETLESVGPDLIIVAAYGLILPQRALDIPRLGAVNLHASLLPAYRGASPIQSALLAGDSETGVTLMQMDKGMDTGDIIRQQRIALDQQINAIDLTQRVAKLGAEMIGQLLADYPNGGWPRTPQDSSRATAAPKLVKENGRMDFTQDARAEHNRVRALIEWPTAFIERAEGPLKVLETQPLGAPHPHSGVVIAISPAGIDVACGQGALRIQRVVPPGRSAMGAADWARGARLSVGDSIGGRA